LVPRRVRDFKCSRITNKYYRDTKHPSSEIEALIWIDESGEIVSIDAKKHEFSLFINLYWDIQ